MTQFIAEAWLTETRRLVNSMVRLVGPVRMPGVIIEGLDRTGDHLEAQVSGGRAHNHGDRNCKERNLEALKLVGLSHEAWKSSGSNPEVPKASNHKQGHRKGNAQHHGYLRPNECSLGQIRAVLGGALLDRRELAKAAFRASVAVLRSDNRASVDGAVWARAVAEQLHKEDNPVLEAVPGAAEFPAVEVHWAAAYLAAVLSEAVHPAVAGLLGAAEEGADEQTNRMLVRS
jgi:hypothetical protein